MISLHSMYRPVTAQPFLQDETYTEVQPCELLRPYVCCFWGTPGPFSNRGPVQTVDKLVIPDTCMDIIFHVDGAAHEVRGLFVGISDTPFVDQGGEISTDVSCFAIRFYSWAVPLFSCDSMRGALNSFTDADAYFTHLLRDIQDILIQYPLMADRVSKVEEYLLRRLNPDRQNPHVMNALYQILKSKGTAAIPELAGYTAVSQRQLERLFLEYVGASPKRLSGLVRYQYLWQELLGNRNFHVQDGVYRYGYADQSHLLNDFKKFHTLSPTEARMFAHARRHVDFLQYPATRS